MSLLILIAIGYFLWLMHKKNTDPEGYEQMRAKSAERNKKVAKGVGTGLMTLLKLWLK